MEQTKVLAKFCKETTYDGLPKEVVKIAKQTLKVGMSPSFSFQPFSRTTPKNLRDSILGFS
ncbi:MAG: hypothetical protein A2170_10705 [Deltaproteobacteria bacterium RBG_13_53_10]|nr:MAG: hypothetical protein A2170_10705 [Deltaproteobacteria bacterium RBG_13_53_10]